MINYLLPDKGQFYKANLHSHSVLSDGHFSVEQMKDEYQKRGYSILAVSDHDFLHRHNDLSTDDFLMLTAYEIGLKNNDDSTPYVLKKVVDLNLIAKNPEEKRHIGFCPDSVKWLVDKGTLKQEQVYSAEYVGELKKDMHYSPDNVNEIIKSATENGFLVILNHPMYSLTNIQDYGQFEGMLAVELYNHGCNAIFGLSDSEALYDDILRSGKRINCIATDDNHNTFPISSYRSDSFGGFTMIKAEKLDYSSVINALEKGWFYASTGPEITELYYDNGKIYIKTSPAAEISMLTLGRNGTRVAGDNDELICKAVFDIDDAIYGYVRFRVTDAKGNKAWTNPYYVSEFDKN